MLKKGDLYFGAVLSFMINHKIAPAIVEPGEKRRVYSIENDRGRFQLFIKYAVKKKNLLKSDERKRKDEINVLWNFEFNLSEIEQFVKMDNLNQEVLLVLLAVHEKYDESEIAVLDYNQAKELFAQDYKHDKRRITVKREGQDHRLLVYGTGLQDLQALVISRHLLVEKLSPDME